jgi:acyl carrier protein
MALEEEFCITIPDAEAEKIQSNADAISFICAHPQAK